MSGPPWCSARYMPASPLSVVARNLRVCPATGGKYRKLVQSLNIIQKVCMMPFMLTSGLHGLGAGARAIFLGRTVPGGPASTLQRRQAVRMPITDDVVVESPECRELLA